VLKAWEREFERWAPDINVVLYIGTRVSREIIQNNEMFVPGNHQKPKIKFNALLTTYEILLKDSELLRSFFFFSFLWSVISQK